jgi:hypothetical protein
MRLPLVGQFQIARVGSRARMPCPLTHALHDEDPFSGSQLLRRFQRVLPVDVGEVALRIRFQLFHQTRDQVEGLMQRWERPQSLHHVQIVLQGVQRAQGIMNGPHAPADSKAGACAIRRLCAGAQA